MRSLSDKESHTTGKSLLYRGRAYASDRAQASVFVQKYAKVCDRESAMDSRKAVMDLRCLNRSTPTTPSQQIDEAFISDKHQQALSQLNAGKVTGTDDIAPDLKHLSTMASPDQLSILNSNWISSWCPQSWRSAYVIPFLKKRRTQHTWEATER